MVKYFNNIVSQLQNCSCIVANPYRAEIKITEESWIDAHCLLCPQAKWPVIVLTVKCWFFVLSFFSNVLQTCIIW